MKRGHDIGGSGFKTHFLKGLFLTVHVLESCIRINQ